MSAEKTYSQKYVNENERSFIVAGCVLDLNSF